jgi:2,4-dienoyl-CoA reductase-like NADH-dependent reductase (Old Yellow Enzyme family)/thioredoxin reductase
MAWRCPSVRQNYPHLFSPIRIGNVTFRNRIFATPITSLSDMQSQIAFFEQKARGGAAQVSLAETSITGKYLVEPKGTTFVLDAGEYELGRLGEFVIAIKAYGAVPSVQLNHHGQQVRPDRNDGRSPIGPMGFIREDGVKVLAMDEDMIEEAIEAYANAALFCKKAGFEMVQVHGAHGWLIAQFLSPYNNRRTDRWGGNLKNRARFPMEVINRIRQKCGRDFLIEYRISGDEMIEGGMQIDDVIEFVKMIEDSIDIIHVSAGIHDNLYTIKRMFPIIWFTKPGCNVDLAEAVKKQVNLPVITVGGINTPEHAEQILADGKADIIGMGRQLICDPEFPNKARRGLREDIIPCMRCNSCIAPLVPGGNFHFGCAANPRIGRDRMLQRIQEPEASRRVVVVGGGPGGMMAAITAAERGHKVTLLEKSGALGGLLKTIDQEPAKWEVKRYKDFLVSRTHKMVTDIRLNTEAIPEVVEALNPDVVIAAVGSKPIVPELTGMDKEKALTVMDVYYNTEAIGQDVVIVGGGLLGCEAALFLSERGRKVTIIEMLNKIGDPTYPHYNIPLVEAIDNDPNISYKLQTKCVAVTPEGVRLEKDGKEEIMSADSIVFLIGQTPELETVEKFRDCALQFYSVGDCVKPQRIMEATRMGFFSAMNIR